VSNKVARLFGDVGLVVEVAFGDFHKVHLGFVGVTEQQVGAVFKRLAFGDDVSDLMRKK
jgi:hypothetical protein